MVFALFIILILISVAFSKKKLLSLLFQSLAILVIVIGPFLAYHFVNEKTMKLKFEDIVLRQLRTQNLAIVEGFVKNESKKVLKDCKITATFFKDKPTIYEEILFRFKPKAKASIILDNYLYPAGVLKFKIVGKKITYNDEIAISLNGVCK